MTRPEAERLVIEAARHLRVVQPAFHLNQTTAAAELALDDALNTLDALPADDGWHTLLEDKILVPFGIWLSDGNLLVITDPVADCEIEIGDDGSISGGPVDFLREVTLPSKFWARCSEAQRRLFKAPPPDDGGRG